MNSRGSIRLQTYQSVILLLKNLGHKLGRGNMFESIYQIFAAMLMGGFDASDGRFYKSEAHTKQAQLACALELFRRARGAFPEKLDELVPDFIAAIPADLMDDAPMRYRRTPEGGFDLWSVAMNREDGHAANDPKIHSTTRQLDWVWRRPAK